MSLKPLAFAAMTGALALVLSGCVGDSYYYDDGPYDRGGYYMGSAVVYDSGVRFRNRDDRVYRDRDRVRDRDRPRYRDRDRDRDYRDRVYRPGRYYDGPPVPPGRTPGSEEWYKYIHR